MLKKILSSELASRNNGGGGGARTKPASVVDNNRQTGDRSRTSFTSFLKFVV